MSYYKTLLFISCLSVFYVSNAQVNPDTYNKDSLEKMIQNMKDDIRKNQFKYLKDIPGIPQSLPFIDSNSEEQKEYSAAMKKLNDALKLGQEKGDKKGIAESYLNLGNLNIEMNKPAQANQYLQNGVQVAKELNDKDFLASAYGNLSSLASRQGNYKGAYEYYKLYTLYRDSVENVEISKRFLQAQLKHDYEIKEANIRAAQAKKDAAAKRTRNIQYFIIISFGIIILAALVILFIQRKNNRQKQQANLLLLAQKDKVEGALSELKSTQAQLIQSEKMASLGELIAGIAHEIQNPLNFVNNFSEVNHELVSELQSELKTGNVDEAMIISNDIKDNEEKINHHGKRADSIVKGMLQHSRQTSGTKELTDINALCDEYLRLSYHGLRAKDKEFNADFKTDFDESIGKINIVPQDIGRVLLNLFNNAFYAVNEKKKLMANGYQPMAEVKSRRINDKIEITVTDNGNGIPQNIIDKIFQPFFTTKPTGQGTGLGLSLAYDIITKEHNGTIKAESKVDEGTRFIIQLPA